MKCHIFVYTTTKFENAQHDSRLVAYGGHGDVVLQQFEFIKVCVAKIVIF